ncbi:MAG TPA: arginine--tRNA ligase, partial [Dongiaceae bacterium]|nr:arginine--tRNA ligase [Dongiaceae bacterium]
MLVRTVRNAVVAAVREAFPEAGDITPEIEVPRDSSHGDYSTNVALMLAKPMRKPPRALGDELAARLA